MPEPILLPAETLAARIRSVARRRLTPDVTYDPDRTGLMLASEVEAGEPHLAVKAHRLLVAAARQHLKHWGGVEPAISQLVNHLDEFLDLHGFEYQGEKWTRRAEGGHA